MSRWDQRLELSTKFRPRSIARQLIPTDGDLFFPKPFNDDQVQIIRRLEKSEGLVVQGPPGTGKTHSIANIISHMLATGKRVLVVSHGEAALKVLRDHLPDGIRDLAISVTASEREGIKQVEKAVQLQCLEIVGNSVDANLSKQTASIRDLAAGVRADREALELIDRKLADHALVHYCADIREVASHRINLLSASPLIETSTVGLQTGRRRRSLNPIVLEKSLI